MELINCNLNVFPLRLLQCQLPKMTSLIYLLRCKVLKLLFSITYTNPDCVYLLKENRDSETKSECGITRHRKNYEVHGKKQFVFILFFWNNFIYFWLCWVIIAAWAFSLVVASGGYPIVVVCGLLIEVASLVAEHGLQGAQASLVVSHGLSSCDSWALEHRLSSGGTQAQLLCDMWDLPGSGTEPMSLALAGRLFTTEPPGKPQECFF